MSTTTFRNPKGDEFPAWDLHVPGLVITKAPTNYGNECWAIVHADSRTLLMWFEDPETAAKALTVDIAPLTNWDRPGQDLQAEPGLGDKVLAIARSAGGSTASSVPGTWKP